MKAMVVKRPKERLILEERERPTLGPGQALIKVHACGVCHSDLHALLGDFPFAKFPLVLGHEVAGVVEAFGEGVNWPKVGTRVGMPWLYSACGHCPACLKGDEVLCPEMQVTGVTVDGGYAEYMQAPAAYLTPIPDELTFEEAAPLMCAGLTVYNALVNAGFKPGQKVAVIGLGGLGHMAVAYAKAMGGRVAAVSSSSAKEAQAKMLGAERFIDTGRVGVADGLKAWDGGADVVLATAPNAKLATEAIKGLGADGVVVVIGVMSEPIEASAMELISGRKKLIGSPSGSRKDLRNALEIAAKLGVRAQVSTYGLTQANEVLEKMQKGELPGRAVLVPR